MIKPAKVSLPGLKVVGRIDLPEPKKKGEATDVNAAADADPQAEEEQEEARPVQPRGRRIERRRPQENKPGKNPIALKREREERDALRKKLEVQKKEKELRTQRYLRKLQEAMPQKKLNKKRRTEEQYETLESPALHREPPKSILNKIWRWLMPPGDY